MPCKHKQDKMWSTDLLWYYTHQAIVDLVDNEYTQGWFDPWYGRLDPKNLKRDRHRVYELLLDEPKPTNWRNSKVPWNQENPDFAKYMAKKRYSGLNCGPASRIFVSKFMKFVRYPSRNYLNALEKGHEPLEAIRATVKSYTPVLVGLGHKNKRYVSHNVAIVGHRQVASGAKILDHFLIIEPYGDYRWGSVEYGYCADGSRGKTSFLGELAHDAKTNELVYINKPIDYRVLKY